MNPELRSVPEVAPRGRAVCWPRLGLMAVVVASVAALTISCAGTAPEVRAYGASARAPRVLPSDELFEVDPGGRVRISDGESVVADGVYTGIGEDSDSAYARRYTAASDRVAALGLPPLGDSVRMAPRSIRRRVAIRTGTFAGFDYLGIRLREANGGVRRVPMAGVDSLWRSDGRGVSGSDLAHHDADHDLPSRTLIMVRQSTHGADGRRRVTTVRVPWESAREVESSRAQLSSGSNAVGVALVAGLVGAGIMLWAIGRSIDDAFGECGSNIAMPPPPGIASELRHLRRATCDFDRFAGSYVEPEATLAVR